MAYKISKVEPIDLQPSKAVGVSLPFNANGVFSSTYQTKDAIKTNLINFMLTGKGERFMNPTFGTNLRNFLFEQIDTAELGALEKSIADSISMNFPKVVVNLLKISTDIDRNSITLSMKYSIKDTSAADTITINFV